MEKLAMDSVLLVALLRLLVRRGDVIDEAAINRVYAAVRASRPAEELEKEPDA